jgi:hypothetical protein
MKTILCIFALLVLTASTADAYVRRHPVARGAAVAAGTAAVVGTAAVAARPWGYGVYGPGGYYGPTAVAPVSAGWSVGNRPWTYDVYGPGGNYGPRRPVAPVGPGWGVGARPADYDVYGPGGNYADAPGTCYRDCDNYRKMLRESGYNPKNYRTSAGTVKQTGY